MNPRAPSGRDLLLLTLGGALCACSTDAIPTTDAADTSVVDVSAPDAPLFDATTPDTPASDVSAPDVAVADTAVADTGTLDARVTDGSAPDVASADAGVPPADMAVRVDAGPRLAAWSRRYGDVADQDCFALALDDAGDVFLSTYILGTVNFGNGPLSGMDRVALAKLSPAGDTLWSRIYPNGGHQYSLGIAVSSAGQVFIGGGFEGTLNFGAPALVSAGGDDIFAASFDAAGATRWSRRYGDAMLYQRSNDVVTDHHGNVLLAGEFTGSATFGTSSYTGVNRDLFVLKLDASGTVLWSRAFGDGQMQYATGVAVDGDDNVLVSGNLDGRVDLGGGAVGSGTGLFLARFSPTGAFQWARAFATAGSQPRRNRVATDAAGNVYVAGNVIGAIDFGDGMTPGRGDSDVFVAKFDATGRLLWHHEYGDAMRQEVTDLAVDAAGNAVVVGAFDGTVNFGGAALTSLGGDEYIGGDMFLVKLNPDGSHRFSARYGDAMAQRGQSIAIDARGDAVVAGAFRGQIDLGSGALTSAGGTDIFVARIPLP